MAKSSVAQKPVSAATEEAKKIAEELDTTTGSENADGGEETEGEKSGPKTHRFTVTEDKWGRKIFRSGKNPGLILAPMGTNRPDYNVVDEMSFIPHGQADTYEEAVIYVMKYFGVIPVLDSAENADESAGEAPAE